MTIKLEGVENMTGIQRHKYLQQVVTGQISTEKDFIAILGNTSAAIKAIIQDLNWAGFYLVKGKELVLGPFQGLPACTRLQFDKGVCAKAWREKVPILVEDVEEFEGHVACDSASKSELVIPLIENGEVIGVLDLDSPTKNRFTEEDKEEFSKLVDIIMKETYN